jgi:competence protein ComEC
VAGFLVLTGTQPSVLRAAAMGTIALLGLGSGGRQRGVRALGVGVLFLLLVDPWLAASIGFALSVVATGGILLLAPRWREQLSRWLPRWAAELIAVPLAAQIACTPLIAAISGQISLVAVLANLLAAPLVAPATVLGLIGGLVALVYLPAAQVIAAPAGWSATGLVAIARHGAAIPQPAVAWSTGPIAVAVLALVCVVVCWSLERLLRHRVATLLAAGLMTVTMVQPLPTPGWPAPGWVMVACSVGQGDGLVLRVADRSAVVVDAGPDPRLMDQCLSRLNITVVPVVLFTHFHADHVDGLPGVLAGRRVGQIVTSSLADPAGGAAAVAREAHAAGVPERVATAGESVTIGPLRWRVLAPLRTDYPDSDSPPNDSSVVLLVQVRGLRILMMGDQERPSQSDLREHYPGLQADVLKVAHHGSSKQDTQLVRSLGARLAVISVGLNNDYGHPASSTMDLLHRAGMQVRRTDLEGDVAVVERDGVLESVAREASQ